MRRGAGAFSGILLACLVFSASAAAATTTVECGLFRDYVAPDPLGPTDGSITFGLSGTPEIIAADATLVPPADTNLGGLAGGAPTALTVVRDTGVITSLAFAGSCTLTADVTFVTDLFGPGADGYTVGDRVFAPAAFLAINDGLAALIPTAAANGVQLSLTFTIDTSVGSPNAFDADLTLVGPVKLKNNGDIVVGAARLPSSVISDQARDQLREAHRLGVDATVVVTGNGGPDAAAPGGVAMAITLDVRFQAPKPEPSPSDVPDTAISLPSTTGQPLHAIAGVLGLAIAGVATVSAWQPRGRGPGTRRRRAR